MTIILLFGLAIDINSSDVEQLIRAGLEYAYTEQFDSASMYFDEIMSKYPQNPSGYFMKAALLQLKMMDACRFEIENEYMLLMRKAASRAQEVLDDNEEDLWAEFYLANTYVYQAVYRAFRKDYFETFKLGVKGGRMMQALVRRDSTFYDAYLSAGTFEYFWARASRYLPFFNLGGGDVEGAIEKLHAAAEKSLYSGPTACNSLAFIYGEEGEYQKAVRIIDSLLVQYPGSRTFMWNKAELEFNNKNFWEAVELFAELHARYDAMNDKNYANLAQCRLYIGKCFVEMGDKANARENLKEVIKYKEHWDEYPQIRGYSREAYSLLSRLL